jgi:hypothetical protein
MPNWVTTRISTSKEVIASMVTPKGNIDFSNIIPFTGVFSDWNSICSDAEEAAEIALGFPVSNNSLIAQMQIRSRKESSIKKLSDSSFAQFVGMLVNYRSCGYLHNMDFNRKVWGTKWNACESDVNLDEGKASFNTAWSCPIPVLEAISKRFPNDKIDVVFADEDIGSNCGKFTLLGGTAINSDIAPSWRDMTEDQKEKWTAFAYEVKDWIPDEDDNDD